MQRDRNTNEEKEEDVNAQQKTNSDREEEDRKRHSRRKDDDAAGGQEGGESVDLWTLLQREYQQCRSAQQRSPFKKTQTTSSLLEVAPITEQFVLFVGGKRSGKSSLVNYFINTDAKEEPRPTVALEYSYLTKQTSSKGGKDIAHVWELGGGFSLSSLIQVPITPQRLPGNIICITVDLSQPWQSVHDAVKWIQHIESRIEECSPKVREKDRSLFSEMQKRMERRVRATKEETDMDNSNPDKHSIRPLLVPLVLAGTKHDHFRDFDAPQRKLVMQCLRYLAHTYGAAFFCVSLKEMGLLSSMRSYLNHVAFGTTIRENPSLDNTKPVISFPGSDSFQDIGPPPGYSFEDLLASNSSEESQRIAEAFLVAIEQAFPEDQRVTTSGASDEHAAQEDFHPENHPEPAVDEVKAQKEEELNLYIKDVERKLKQEAKAQSSGEKEKKSSKKRSKSKK